MGKSNDKRMTDIFFKAF